MPHKNLDGTCLYPPLEEEISEAGVQEVDTYVTLRQNTVAKFIAVRPIMDLCLEAARRTGDQVSNRRWEQEGKYIEGIREAYEAAEVER